MSASRFALLFAGCLFATAAQTFIEPPELLPLASIVLSVGVALPARVKLVAA